MPKVNYSEAHILRTLNEEVVIYRELDENENILKYYIDFFEPTIFAYCIVNELCEVINKRLSCVQLNTFNFLYCKKEW